MKQTYSQGEFRNHLMRVITAEQELGRAVRNNLERASRWDDPTKRELVENICRETENILHRQIDSPAGQGIAELEWRLSDAFAAYAETTSGEG